MLNSHTQLTTDYVKTEWSKEYMKAFVLQGCYVVSMVGEPS